MLYDEAILTDVIDLTTEIAPARDYANKVAEYTNDPQLINIAKEMNKALDEAIIGRCDLHFSPYGDLPKFSLSVVLCSQED